MIFHDLFCDNKKLNYLCTAFEQKAFNFVIVPWCNGSTPGFGSVSLGSNPGGTTINRNTDSCSAVFIFMVQIKGQKPYQ